MWFSDKIFSNKLYRTKSVAFITSSFDNKISIKVIFNIYFKTELRFDVFIMLYFADSI